jgi:hypothetical protein
MKIRQWDKAQWTFIAGLATWAALTLIVLLVGKMQLSDRIQAASMITLVFITMFYAVQTQALVKEERRALEEEKKRRSAEFGERKIVVLLGPLSTKLIKYDRTLLHCFAEMDKDLFHENTIEAKEELIKIEESFRANMHMASESLRGELLSFFRDSLLSFWRSAAWSQEEKVANCQRMMSVLNSLIRTVELEIEKITTHIQNTYGIGA